MIINEQRIRELQKRVDISYEEAEKYLRRAGGDIDLAEQMYREQENSLGKRILRELEKMIDLTIVHRLELFREEEIFIDLPILVFIVLLMIVGVNSFLFLGVVFVIVSLLLDCRLRIHKVPRNTSFSFHRTVYKDETTRKNQQEKKSRDQQEDRKTHSQNIDNENFHREDTLKKRNKTAIIVDAEFTEESNNEMLLSHGSSNNNKISNKVEESNQKVVSNDNKELNHQVVSNDNKESLHNKEINHNEESNHNKESSHKEMVNNVELSDTKNSNLTTKTSLNTKHPDLEKEEDDDGYYEVTIDK